VAEEEGGGAVAGNIISVVIARDRG